MKSVQKPNKFVVKETILVILNNYLLVGNCLSAAGLSAADMVHYWLSLCDKAVTVARI